MTSLPCIQEAGHTAHALASSSQAVTIATYLKEMHAVFITSYCTCASFYSSMLLSSMHVLCQQALINLAAMVVSPPRICKLSASFPTWPETPNIQSSFFP